MILTFKQLSRVLVFTRFAKNAQPVAKMVDCVINAQTGLFEAFWVMTLDGMKLLQRGDILQWEEFQVRVKSKDVFVEADSVVRMKKIIEEEIPILKAKVFCNQKLLGRVHNFSFDTVSPRILHLYVRGGLLGARRYIIHSSRIYKIDVHGIHIWDNATLKSLEKHVKEKETSPKEVSSTVSEMKGKREKGNEV